MGRGAALLSLALLGGCATVEDVGMVEHRVADLALELDRLESRVDQLVGLERRLAALEQAAGVPRPPAPAEAERDLARDASLAELRVRLERVEQALVSEGGGEGTPRPDRRVVPLPKIAAPPAGSAVQVMALDGGDTLLGRVAGKPWRLRLAGVSAPQRAEAYVEDPALRQAHPAASGRAPTEEDWRRSRDFSAKLVDEGGWTLRYPPGGPSKDRDDGLLVVLEREGSSLNERIVASSIRLQLLMDRAVVILWKTQKMLISN